jgi:hypothetical protein
MDHIEYVSDSPRVVFMTMRYDDGAYLGDFILQITEIGDDVVNPQHIVLRKHDAGVNHEDVFPVLDSHHILPNFA